MKVLVTGVLPVLSARRASGLLVALPLMIFSLAKYARRLLIVAVRRVVS
jgi:hypothetical protein